MEKKETSKQTKKPNETIEQVNSLGVIFVGVADEGNV